MNLSYSIIGGYKELEELLRSLKALDLITLFDDEKVGIDDLMSFDLNDLTQLGLSLDRAQQLQEEVITEKRRISELLTALKGSDCMEVYDTLVKMGYASVEVYSMDHYVLKKIGLSFPERKKFLAKIQPAMEKSKGNLFL